jgi:phosphate transport system permease protein
MTLMLDENTLRRVQSGKRGEKALLLSTAFGLMVLVILLLTIFNDAFGIVAVKEVIHPETLVTDGQTINQLSNNELTSILQTHLSKGKMQALLLKHILPTDVDRTKLGTEHIGTLVLKTISISESSAQKTFAELSVEEISALLAMNLSQQMLVDEIYEQVVGSEIIQSWSFLESTLNRANIEREVRQKANGENLPSTFTTKQIEEIKANYSAVRLQWKAWLSLEFILKPTTSVPGTTGFRGAIIGSILILLIAILLPTFIGVSTAIYLEEYAREFAKYRRSAQIFYTLIQMNIRTLVGVPSVIYGLFGLTFYGMLLEPLTSGEIFGIPGGNGRTILTAGLTLGTLVLPVIIINAQEAIKSVPYSLREASYGLHASRSQTILRTVLPSAIPGIMTGVILSLSRAIGETAPLVIVGAAVFLSKDPLSPFSPFTTMTVQIYNWTAQPNDQFRNIASAAIAVLIMLVVGLNMVSIIIRYRYTRRLQ